MDHPVERFELPFPVPETMHPYAGVFMHPPQDGGGSAPMAFEIKHMNSLGRHLERLGFRQVAEPLDRYEVPQSGDPHPDNPGAWVPVTRPPRAPAPEMAVVEQAITMANSMMSPADRKRLGAALGFGDQEEDTDG